jgi:MFS family permease
VLNVVVVVGGDVVVASDGRVGAGAGRAPDDAAVVSVFGDLVVEPGAVVSGRVVDVGGEGANAVDAMVVNPVVRPWKDWEAIAGWIGSTVFIVLVAAIVAAIAPKQLVRVSERARRHLFSSLGWGALGLMVIVPLVSILLVVTLIGILALLPWWLAAVVALLFGYAGVGTLIGRLLMGKSEQRGRVMLAAVIGVAVLSVVRWIPIAGSVVVFLALLVGLGATFTAIWEWRRRPRGAWPQRPPTDPPVV